MQQAFAVILTTVAISATAQHRDAGKFILQDERKLSLLKKQYKDGNTVVVKEINAVIADADKALNLGPFSVTFNKTRMAPSNDPHDYMSQAPYWWPDPSKSDGKPYIRKDGQRNPEIYEIHDDSQMVKLAEVVKTLGFAYYFTGKDEYSVKAAALLKVWFIDAETRMNPNLNYAQYIPGINDGRGIGIIESRTLTSIPDALAMMESSKSITEPLKSGVKEWFNQYLDWLINSKNGKDEHLEKNNHGTNYDWQVVDFAIYTGKDQLARNIIKQQTIPRMDVQFTTNGEQPLELARTRSWEYTNMNTYAWCKLAILADRLDIDLWHTQTKDGKSIGKCITWFLPYLLKQKTWDHQQIAPMSNNEILSVYHMADGHYPEIDFQKVFSLYPAQYLWM